MWIASAVVLCVYYVVLTGVLGIVADGRSYLEQRESLSIPLSYLNHNFYITGSTPNIDVAGIALANSFFYGGLMASCWYVVRAVSRRNRVAKMNLSGNPEDTDDE
jgi:hypothetical protein